MRVRKPLKIVLRRSLKEEPSRIKSKNNEEWRHRRDTWFGIIQSVAIPLTCVALIWQIVTDLGNNATTKEHFQKLDENNKLLEEEVITQREDLQMRQRQDSIRNALMDTQAMALTNTQLEYSRMVNLYTSQLNEAKIQNYNLELSIRQQPELIRQQIELQNEAEMRYLEKRNLQTLFVELLQQLRFEPSRKSLDELSESIATKTASLSTITGDDVLREKIYYLYAVRVSALYALAYNLEALNVFADSIVNIRRIGVNEDGQLYFEPKHLEKYFLTTDFLLFRNTTPEYPTISGKITNTDGRILMDFQFGKTKNITNELSLHELNRYPYEIHLNHIPQCFKVETLERLQIAGKEFETARDLLRHACTEAAPPSAFVEAKSNFLTRTKELQAVSSELFLQYRSYMALKYNDLVSYVLKEHNYLSLSIKQSPSYIPLEIHVKRLVEKYK